MNILDIALSIVVLVLTIGVAFGWAALEFWRIFRPDPQPLHTVAEPAAPTVEPHHWADLVHRDDDGEVVVMNADDEFFDIADRMPDVTALMAQIIANAEETTQ